MKQIFKIIISLGLFLQISNIAFAENYEAIVNHVIDGDTLITKAGEHIRLLDINTPEVGKRGKPSQPFAKKAKEYLTGLALNKKIIVKQGKTPKDRYKRTLAHLYLTDGTWLNKQMIESGLAHVYSFPDNRSHVTELLTYEGIARKSNKGIWSHERWKVKDANQSFKDSDIGSFHLVKGKVTNAVHVKNKTYLNFGNDWRTDFTVEIPDSFKAVFVKNGSEPKNYYLGKNLIVRGVIKPVNGALITVTHPEQLTILE